MGLPIIIYDEHPGWEAISKLNQIAIIDVQPLQSIKGEGTGTVVVVGEFLKGDFNTPTKIINSSELETYFGGFDRTISTKPELDPDNPGELPSKHFEGNGYLAIARRKFASLVLVRANVSLASSTERIEFTLTRSGTDDPYTLPAGSIITGANNEETPEDVTLATMNPVTFAAGSATAKVYCRPLTDTVCGKGFDEDGISDVVNETVNGKTCPATTTRIDGDITAPFPTGMTMGAAAVSHDAFTAQSWAQIVNTAYATAIGNSTTPGGAFANEGEAAERDVVLSARHWAGGVMDDCSSIRSALSSHATDSAKNGIGVHCLIRPPFEASLAVVKGDTDSGQSVTGDDPGISAYATNKRVIYCYPHLNVIIPEVDSQITIPLGFDSYVASMISQQAPEEPISQYHQHLEDIGIVSVGQIRTTSAGEYRHLTLDDYRYFQSGNDSLTCGICAPDHSKQHGWTCMAQVAADGSSISRQRMADYVELSIGKAIEAYKSTLNREDRDAGIVSQVDSFLSGLVEKPERIAAYSLDISSGNSETTENLKIKVIRMQVKLLNEAASFALVTELGETVTITQAN